MDSHRVTHEDGFFGIPDSRLLGAVCGMFRPILDLAEAKGLPFEKLSGSNWNRIQIRSRTDVYFHSIPRKPPPLVGDEWPGRRPAGRKPGWSARQTGSRRDKIPMKPPPLVVVRDFEVCHSLSTGIIHDYSQQMA
jgi:hypothetical protein